MGEEKKLDKTSLNEECYFSYKDRVYKGKSQENKLNFPQKVTGTWKFSETFLYNFT